MTNKALSLSELINDVANELRIAHSLAQEKSPVMTFTDCEIELKVNIVTEGKAGIKLVVADFGGGGKKEKTHTVKIKFKAGGETIAVE